ncbi:hypothetical protein MPSEU_000458800 [Mayamaea pseudoterrestris]|nr:hypothetical protein MPSEU_000458800 [Mayamaea pseudoterrestris]
MKNAVLRSQGSLAMKRSLRFLSIGGATDNSSSTISSSKLSSSATTTPPTNNQHQRIWDTAGTGRIWTERVADQHRESLSDIIGRIQDQELAGGRLRAKQLGVLHDDPATDMELLTTNYTVKAIASALRDREDILQQAAVLADENRFDELKQLLKVCHPRFVSERRTRRIPADMTQDLNSFALESIRKALMRRPRTVTQAHSKRAGVVIPLCTVDGVPSVLFEKRAKNIRAHADEVCLPGGMVCQENDPTIVQTCLREMQEEIGGIDPVNITVLGVLRCNWGEVHHLVGIAVTPVVCFLGEMPTNLSPNADEVAEVFTIPLSEFPKRHLWVRKEGMAPIFLGGPYVIWGLTGYILDRFYRDILLPNNLSSSDEGNDEVSGRL